MTITSSLSPLTTGLATKSAGSSKEAGNYNAFLQLLVTELKTQDPMKPLDPTQTVSQLATFSTVEQAVQTNALLSSLNGTAAVSQAGSLVGRTVTSSDGATRGVVTSVAVGDTGLTATLQDGRSLALGAGVTIS